MKQYAEKVSTMVSETLNKETEVMEVPKVNEKLTGICVKDGKVGAVFYIDEFFENGMSEEKCAEIVVASYEEYGKPEFDAENIDFSFEAIKDRLAVRLVSIEKNKALLDKLVYKDMGCGLAIIPAIDNWEMYMTNVSKSLAEHEGYDTEELVTAALRSSAKSAPAVMRDLASATFGGKTNLLENPVPVLIEEGGLFVLSNEKNANGASAMFYEGVLDKAMLVIGSSFYILPSSIHEVILVPSTFSSSVSDFKKMVVTANKTVVEPYEVLSDDIYFYDGRLRKVA